jgi:hypothetical protein
MADNKFLLYDEQIKNNDKFNPNPEDFQDKQLITRADFENMLDTDNYSWSGEKYQQNQFIYEYEIDNVTEISKTSISNLFESTLASTAYNKATQYYEFTLGKDSDYILTEGTDFSVDGDCEIIPGNSLTNYSAKIKISGTNPDDYEVTIHGEGEYDGNVTLVFEINKKSINNAEYSYDTEMYTYNGQAQLPIFTFDFGTDGNGNEWKITSNNIIYTSTPEAKINAGNYEGTFVVDSSESQNYTGEKTVNWTIKQQSTEINITNDSITADGSGHGFEVTNNSSVDGTIYYVITTSSNWPGNYDSDEQIEANSTITIGNVSTIGTHYIWAYFEPNDTNYSDSESKMGTLTITEPDKIDISDYTVNLSQDTYIYNGNEQTPEVTVSYDNQTLTADTDYDIEYPNDSTNAGTKTITITGKGNYTGRTTANYEIKKANPNVQLIGLEAPFNHNYQYCEAKNISSSSAHSTSGILYYGLDNGDGQRPMDKSVELNIGDTVKLNALLIGDSGEYTIWGVFIPTDQNNWNTLQNLTCILKITPIKLTSSNTQIRLTPDTFVYDGNPKTPEVSLVYDYYTGVDITPTNVTYQNNTNAGDHPNSATASIEVNERNYIGTLTKQFTINKADSYLDIGFGATDDNDNVYTSKTVVYDPNTSYETYCTVYNGDDYAIQGTIYYKITNEEIANLTKDMLTDTNEYTEEGENSGYIWLDMAEYTDAGEYYLYAYFEPDNNNYEATDIEEASLIIEQAESALQISEIGDGKYDGTGSHLLQFFTKLSEYPSNLPGIIYYGEGNYNNNVSINANGAPATASACWIQNVSDSPKTINIKFEPTNKNYTTIETTYDLTLEPRELDGTMFAYNLIGNQSTFTYDGTQKTPGVTVSVKHSTDPNNTTPVTEDNYTIQYGENINAGKDAGSVTIIGKNNLSGSFTLNFTINKANLNCYFKNDSNQIIYNGEEHTFDFQAYTFNDINPTYVGTGTLTYTITHNNIPSQFTEYDVEHNSDLTNWSATNTGQYYINATFTPDNTNYNTCSDITGVFEITPRYRNLYISRAENNIELKNTGNATMYLDDTLQLYVYAECVSDIYPQGYIIDVSGEQNLTVNVSDDNIVSLNNLIVSADDIGTAIISAEYTIYGETHSHTFTINVQEVVDLIVSMDSNLTEIPQNDPELHFVYNGGYNGSGNVSSDCFELTDGNNEANIYVYELLEVSDGVSVSRIVGKNITAGTLCDGYDTIQIQGKYNGQSVMDGCWINANRTDQCWIISAESGGAFISQQNNTSPVGSGQFIVEYDTGSKILSSSSVDFTISNGR